MKQFILGQQKHRFHLQPLAINIFSTKYGANKTWQMCFLFLCSYVIEKRALFNTLTGSGVKKCYFSKLQVA